MDTLYLNSAHDLCLDANGNIAVAANPYALAQDAACAINVFLGECFYDTKLGIDYFGKFLGKTPNIELLRAKMTAEALKVPEVSTAKVYFAAMNNRVISGQVQVTSTSGITTAATIKIGA
jgi:hypothetical protein